MSIVGRIYAFVVCLVVGTAGITGLSAQEAATQPIPIASTDNPISVALLDVLSSTFDQANIRIFTDVLRTDLFKTGVFKIIDRGVILDAMQKEGMTIQGGEVDDAKVLRMGKDLNVKKLLILSINKTPGTIILNVRNIDVATSVLDYTDNIFIKDPTQIYDAIQELVNQLALRQSQKDQPVGPQADKAAWQKMGATADDAAWLVTSGRSLNEYLDLRQFDVDFTIADYMSFIKAGRDTKQLRQFFVSGIRYYLAKQAFDLNVTDTKGYEAKFKPAQISFSDYLDAYKAGIVDPAQFADYKQGFRKVRVAAGIGGVADSVPIVNSSVKFFVLDLAAEYFLTDYQRDTVKSSAEIGLYFLDVIGVTPYLQYNVYVGKYPFYLKVGTGVLAEVLLGGSVGWYGKLGLEAFEHLEISFLTTFLGSQPAVSYTDLKTPEGSPGYVGIKYPYYALFISYKF